MQYKEFKTQVEAHGVKLPIGWGGVGGNEVRYPEYADLGHPGSGNYREFSEYDVRFAVGWAKVHEVTGISRQHAELGRRATQMLALYYEGWVVMTEGEVYWTDTPTKQVFDKGAICIPALKDPA